MCVCVCVKRKGLIQTKEKESRISLRTIDICIELVFEPNKISEVFHLGFTEIFCKTTLYIYISSSSSSSSCRAGSTDIPDPLLPLFPIVHRPWQVFRTTSRIRT